MTHAVKQKTIDLLHEGCSVARNEYIFFICIFISSDILIVCCYMGQAPGGAMNMLVFVLVGANTLISVLLWRRIKRLEKESFYRID